jgi:hypothetical protein
VTEALQPSWPSEPYKGLAHYGPDDRPLFTGRDEDVDVCIHFLAAPETRILLLHGQTGCGKSSFLRAGLIPSLEERAFGYLFLRDTAGAPVFIRCGPDPIGRIAEHLFSFASQPVKIDTARGERVYDVSEACLGCKDVKDYIEACRKPGLLTHSLLALAKLLPYTLVIILDQAEEVITLAEGKSDYRRQFFRFVREFSTTNFPLKLVLALRKDNSGEFIGLAQMGGSLELPPLPTDTGTFQTSQLAANGGAAARDAPATGGDGHTRPVKSDIKIFLLSELTREEVLHAIVQPTLKTPVDDRPPPFDTYQFDYADGVARRIVDDIFDATSSTAVLPVMQIVCRDLYNRATTQDPGAALTAAPPLKRPKPWRIDLTLYETGGGIQGPVDRHVSRSLVGSFGSMVPAGEIKAEERRWRDILFRLVRRESDGTVHTNIVSLAQLRVMADELQPIAKVDQVVEYLTRPDVLLLRRVTILSADDSDEGRWYSLGHDFIGMVLQHWKVRQLEAETAHRRVLKIAKTTGLGIGIAAAVLGTVIYVGYRASEHGKTAQQYQTLVDTSDLQAQREDPMFALLLAAHAAGLATDLSNDLWLIKSERDVAADKLLAGMVAGLPKTVTFAPGTTSAAAGDSPGSNRNMALPKAGGYLVVDAAAAQIVTEGAGERRPVKHELKAMPGVGPGEPSAEAWITIEEPKAGTVLLMRSLNWAPTQDLAYSSHQLFVFSGDNTLGPYDGEDFRHFVEDDSRPRGTPAQPEQRGKVPGKAPGAGDGSQQSVGRLTEQGFSGLDLTGGVVVLYKMRPPSPATTKGTLTVDSFVFDERKSPKPFRRGFAADKSTAIEFEQNPTFGLVAPQMIDGYLLVPRTGVEAQGIQTPIIVRYDLRRSRRGDGQGSELQELEQLLQCTRDQRCQWQLLPRRDTGSLIIFGSTLPSTQIGQQSIDQLSLVDLDNFDRFVVADVSSGRAIEIGAADLRHQLAECAPDRLVEGAGAAAPKFKMPARLFVSGSIDSLIVGFPLSHAIDVIRVNTARSTRTTQCIGTFMVPPDISGWSVSSDGTRLLGVGPKSGTAWSLNQPVKDRAATLLKDKADLVKLACSAGLLDYRPSKTKTAGMSLEPGSRVCAGGAPATRNVTPPARTDGS